MDIKEIKKIVELMKENQLTEFDLQEEGFHITLKRSEGRDIPVVTPIQAPVMMAAPVAVPPVAVPVSSTGTAPGVAPAAGGEDASLANLKPIKSPMVGTFYRAPSPEAESFATIGKAVDEDTVVCIIEAMKVMNEIKAETKGIIRKILIENATSVEFGQPLFLIEPA